MDEDIGAWLAQQPVAALLQVGAHQLYLRPADGGAELGALLSAHADAQHGEAALRLGFASALQFEAGLGVDQHSGALVLSRWLPGVRDWRAAAPALAQLLDQLDYWRAALAPQPAAARAPLRTQEQRIRQALTVKGAAP